MRISYVAIIAIGVLAGDLIVYDGRHLGNAGSFAHRWAYDLNWQVRQNLGRIGL